MTDDRTKPEIDAPEGPAPTDLVIRDLIVGDGAEAKPGDTVTVHYAGVEYETGEEFDSSWNRGESIQFPLRGLIQGWQDGIPGMKVGGRRELVIPPAPRLRPCRRPLPRRQDPDLRHRPHRGRLTTRLDNEGADAAASAPSFVSAARRGRDISIHGNRSVRSAFYLS